MKQLLRRVGIGAAVVAVTYFLVGGGEYGTIDLMKQRTRFDRLQNDVSVLEARVDSLRREHKALTTDRARLERVARERHGMVRGDRELLYYFVNDSSASDDSAGAVPRG